MGSFPQVGDQFGAYRIVAQLGHGGMGVVFSAVQERLNRPVALKVLDPRLAGDEAFKARFTREAAVLAGMDSPHIIRIYDHGEIGGCLYLATQFVAGGDLGRLIGQRGALPPPLALDLTHQIVSALADAHARGVVHRDVKPGNVLIASSAETPFAYLCDFGIAQTGDGRLTEPGMVAGSAAYMAPERHHGAPAGPASDLYSAGCVLWAMLTGQQPYAGTDVQVAMAHLNAPVPQLPGSDPLTAGLNHLLARALAKDPALRYTHAQQMLEDLSRIRPLAQPQPGVAAPNQAPVGPPTPGDTVVRTPLGPAVPPPPAPAVPAPQGPAVPAPPGRRLPRGPLIAVVTALVVVLAGAGAWWFWPRGAGPAATPVTVTTAAPPTTAASPATAAPTTAAPPATAAAPSFLCWDGTTTGDLASCTAPSGTRGLKYLFPSLADGFEDCTYKAYRQTTITYDCPAEGAGVIRYRYWSSPTEAKAHYAEVYPDPATDLILDGQRAGVLYRRDTKYQNLYRISGLFVDGHVSFSVEAPTRARRDELSASALRIRAWADLRGHRQGVAPAEAVIG